MTLNFFFNSILIAKSRKDVVIVNAIGHFVINIRLVLQLVTYDPASMRLPETHIVALMSIQILISASIGYMAYIIKKNMDKVTQYVK